MTSPESLFLGLTPLIGVFDMSEALAFYRDLLGFEVVSASPLVDTPEGRFSHWTWLRLGAAQLMLNTQYDSGERPPSRSLAPARGGTCFYIGCADIDAAYEQLTKRGLQAQPPKLAPYGLKHFAAKEPDGNTIVFQEVR